ncbi:non-ribosomal peptide synthetase [Streptomyces sp. NBC_01217]|uniref:non-ribosomal peptide synthetase n=1 Tax=Streptomyces sp. NBC_01217 TaxID=2903779 RepID=UPI002E131C3A|nr:amino acid adenylation domain-containing protein [Streptomyces sp. NBC_01217]
MNSTAAPLGRSAYVMPASFAQERMWMIEQMEDDAPDYNIQMGLRFTGPLDTPVLERAMTEVFARHDVLRTTFTTENERLFQVISPASSPVHIEHVDLTDARDPEAELHRFRLRELRSPFDLERGPLVRNYLVKVAEQSSVLLMVMDHIVGDAWSQRVLQNELATLHRAFLRGEPSPLPDLAIQYADYAIWQREQLDSGELDGQIAFWRRKLGENPPQRVDLRAEPGRRQGRHGDLRFPLPLDLMERTDAWARGEGASLNAALLALFSLLLAGRSGLRDLAVGNLTSNRPQPELEELIGFFVNCVVLRLDLSGDPSLRELTLRSRNTALEAYAHQEVPFERVVEELHPVREPGRQPLCDVMFQLSDVDIETVRYEGLDVAVLPVESAPAPIDLLLSVMKEGGQYEAVWDYDTDLLDAATITRLQQGFEELLHLLAADPEVRIGELDAMGSAERSLLLDDLSGRGIPAEPERCGYEFVGDWVGVGEGGVALVGEGVEWSYGELGRRVGVLAGVLRGWGVGPEVRVGVCLGRGVDVVVAVLGVWRAGGVVVPLDPGYPVGRLGFMVGDAVPGVVVTSGCWVGRLPVGCGVVLVEEVDWSSGEVFSGDAGVVPANAAYVVYTSGSTGRPKGVVVSHRGLGGLVAEAATRFGVTTDDRVLSFSSPSFDAWIYELFIALAHGARLCVPPVSEETGAVLLEELPDWLRAQHVTVATLPPSLLAAWTDEDLPELRVLSSVGETCAPAVAEHWSRGRVLVNGYGPTETTVGATHHRITEGPVGSHIPIGTPFPGTRVYVLDAETRLVPHGVAGELCVGGPAVARGYGGRPGLTAERFVPDPFAGEPGARMYRTGDRVWWDDEGRLCFGGRLDRQVQIRGFRVEPAEVEAVLTRCPEISEAVVVPREDAAGGRELVAFVTAAPHRTAEPEKLREACGEALPAPWIPARITVLDTLPRLPNGKTDRDLLAGTGPVAEPEHRDTGGGAPLSPLEQLVADIWGEVFDRKDLGRDTDFFDLGGHSLLASRIIARIRAELNLPVPVRTLFNSPVLCEFVTALVALEAGHHE